MPLKRLLREPLLHFLLIGLGLFLWYGRVAPDSTDDRRIVVSAAQVADLARQYEATWRRPPSSAELSGLVDNYVQDEILYREGRALGLDADDPVIKRRVRQKLEIMSEEILAGAAPTDADLAAYLAANPDDFRQPAIVSFEQVYFGSLGPDRQAAARIDAARRELERGADPARFGQATLLPPREEKMPLDIVARTFGQEFAAQLEALPVGQWQGPVASGLGLHLVRLGERTPAALPQLDTVRPLVAREWEAERRRKALDESYRRLREQYDVEIESPLAGSAAAR